MVASLYELQSREKKARVITDWLRANRPDVDADIASRMSQFGRDAVASLAGRTAEPPRDWTTVSKLTWEQVVSRLRQPIYLARVPDDPFSGLPS